MPVSRILEKIAMIKLLPQKTIYKEKLKLLLRERLEVRSTLLSTPTKLTKVKCLSNKIFLLEHGKRTKLLFISFIKLLTILINFSVR